MKNFLLQLVTNRFGIILATINVCAMAPMVATGPIRTSQKLVVDANFPALAAGAPISIFFKDLYGLRFSTAHACDGVVITLGIVAQWLLIAYFARHTAAFIRQAIAARRS